MSPPCPNPLIVKYSFPLSKPLINTSQLNPLCFSPLFTTAGLLFSQHCSHTQLSCWAAIKIEAFKYYGSSFSQILDPHPPMWQKKQHTS